MLQPKYVQSFSSGQITIPKEFRERLKMPKKFWLKMYLSQNKIIAEPVETAVDKTTYQESLLSITGDWLEPEEIVANRKEVEQQLDRHSL